MQRRQALKNIALISAGIALLPACDFETWPTFDKIPLEKPQKKLINWLSDSIIPKLDKPLVTTTEPTSHFVLNMVNDCYAPEDIEKYVAGMNALQIDLDQVKEINLRKLTPAESDQLLIDLIAEESLSEEVRYFLETTRGLTIHHFTSSEYFMTNHLKFEFIPGRYNGCVPA